MKRILCSLLMAVPGAALAHECESVKLEEGKVAVAKPLPLVPSDGCVAALTAALKAETTLAQVTLAARVSDKERVGGKPLAAARSLAEKLSRALAAGVSVSAVAPRVDGEEPAALAISYVVRPKAVLGIVGHAEGTKVGEANAVPGLKLFAGSLIQTARGGTASLFLLGGTEVGLEPGSALRIESVANVAEGQLVSLELVDGAADVAIPQLPYQSSVTVSRGDVMAGVLPIDPTLAPLAPPPHPARSFRFSGDGDDARTQALIGPVGIRSGIVDVSAATGEGFRVDGKGVLVRGIAPAKAPEALTARRGHLHDHDLIKWSAVEGTVGYVVEFARDADFRLGRRFVPAAAPSLKRPDLAPGKWFWRVRGVDENGYFGPNSKIHAFTVNPVGTL